MSAIIKGMFGLLESIPAAQKELYHRKINFHTELYFSQFEAQLLTYMKLLKVLKGILINFNCGNIFKEGQKTFVNEYFKELK